MTYINEGLGLVIVLGFGIIMWLITLFFSNKKQNLESHLVANKNIGKWSGAFSIAISWAWAPAIFLSVQMAYEQGLAGTFWFIVPNVLCLIALGYLAKRARSLMPNGYTFPEYIKKRFNSKVHLLYQIIFFGYQIYAISVNALVGGTLLNLLTGISFTSGVIIMAGIALSYSIYQGLKASIVTDVFQMLLVIVLGAFIIPLVINSAGGFTTIINGLGGVSGRYSNIFNPEIAFGFGIIVTIGLFSGAFSDQEQWQRAMSIKQKYVKKSFLIGGLLFGLIPLMFSLLGFIGASPQLNQLLPSTISADMVGIELVNLLLPNWILVGFVIMILAGLISTLDSAFCASSSLASIDLYKSYINKNASKNKILTFSKIAMIIIAIIGVGIAIIPGISLIYLFIVGETIGATILIPTLFSLWNKRIKSNAVFVGVLSSMIIGLPISIFANNIGNTRLIIISSIAMLVVSGTVSFILSLVSEKN